MPPNFLSLVVLLEGGPRRFNLAIERLLLHLGFDDIRVIDGAGDGGGDILAVRASQLFVFQNKWTTGSSIGRDSVNEVERAKAKYGADRAVVATNAFPDSGAVSRAEELRKVGIVIEFWNKSHLLKLFSAIPMFAPRAVKLRPYQAEAARAIGVVLSSSRPRALLILATGLGKTVVCGEVALKHLLAFPADNILVVAHMKDLVQQLERAFWRHLPKTVRTQVYTSEAQPVSLDGVTFATVASAIKAVYEGYRPSLVVVDETHHLAERGAFQKLLGMLEDARHLGVTATPWRGDEFDITTHFGAPVFRMGIAEGMAQGYLAQVDYKLFVDNVDWSVLSRTSDAEFTIRDLNSRFFLPQRDEAILEILWQTWQATTDPRAIIFCRTVEHAEAVAKLISSFSNEWRNVGCLHSDLGKRERDVLLSQFRLGRTPILTAVDILNEGVDVPDVNIIAFLRVTHSRRIFVQQLGRGLRLKEGKARVAVLDFVTDIRRIAAVMGLRNDLANRNPAALSLNQSSINFTNQDVGTLMEAWVRDAASLETALDEAKLEYPDLPFGSDRE